MEHHHFYDFFAYAYLKVDIGFSDFNSFVILIGEILITLLVFGW